MAKWTENSTIFENDDRIYHKFMDKIGARKLDHMGIVLFGDPISSEFLKNINIAKHIFSTGDCLTKIAHKHYGDTDLWWVIAWFNGKPTDYHCKIGDTLLIPHPVEEVLLQAQNKVSI